MDHSRAFVLFTWWVTDGGCWIFFFFWANICISRFVIHGIIFGGINHPSWLYPKHEVFSAFHMYLSQAIILTFPGTWTRQEPCKIHDSWKPSISCWVLSIIYYTQFCRIWNQHLGMKLMGDILSYSTILSTEVWGFRKQFLLLVICFCSPSGGDLGTYLTVYFVHRQCDHNLQLVWSL